jgi:hypothetical protein
MARQRQVAAAAAEAQEMWHTGRMAAFHGVVRRMFEPARQPMGAGGIRASDGQRVVFSLSEQLAEFSRSLADVFTCEELTPQQQATMDGHLSSLEGLLARSSSGGSGDSGGSEDSNDSSGGSARAGSAGDGRDGGASRAAPSATAADAAHRSSGREDGVSRHTRSRARTAPGRPQGGTRSDGSGSSRGVCAGGHNNTGAGPGATCNSGGWRASGGGDVGCSRAQANSSISGSNGAADSAAAAAGAAQRGADRGDSVSSRTRSRTRAAQGSRSNNSSTAAGVDAGTAHGGSGRAGYASSSSETGGAGARGGCCRSGARAGDNGRSGQHAWAREPTAEAAAAVASAPVTTPAAAGPEARAR